MNLLIGLFVGALIGFFVCAWLTPPVSKTTIDTASFKPGVIYRLTVVDGRLYIDIEPNHIAVEIAKLNLAGPPPPPDKWLNWLE